VSPDDESVASKVEISSPPFATINASARPAEAKSGDGVISVGGDHQERLRVSLDCGHFAAVTGNRSTLLTTHVRCSVCGVASPPRRITSFLGPVDGMPGDAIELKAIPVATCSVCGGRVDYVPVQQLVCSACGRAEQVRSLPSPPVHPFAELAQQLPETTASAETLGGECPNCGSLQQPPPNEFFRTCNACGTRLNFLTRSSRALKPEGILPVTITRDAASSAFRRWTRRRLFAPHRLRFKEADSLKLQYSPLFVFSGAVRARYSGERGRTVGSGKNRRTSWTTVHGTLRWRLTSTAVDVASSQPVLCKTSEWPATEAVGLRDDYLLGATARTYQASPKAAQVLIDKCVLKEAQSLAKRNIGGEKQRVNHVDFEYESLGLAYMLGPSWTSSYYDKGKQFNFRINGRTGKTTGQFPKSKPRIAAAVAALLTILVFAIIGYQSSQHHNAVVAAQAAVCSDINSLWGDLYPAGDQTPSATGLAQMPTTDASNFGALQSDAKTAGRPYEALVRSFVADQSADQAGPASVEAKHIAAACQAAGNGYLVSEVPTPPTASAPAG
jgi:hypothetical protein